MIIVTLSLAIQFGANAQTFDRRQTLRAGLISTLFGKTATRIPNDVVDRLPRSDQFVAAEAAARDYRKSILQTDPALKSFSQLFNSPYTPNLHATISGGMEDIIRDWAKHNPQQVLEVREDLDFVLAFLDTEQRRRAEENHNGEYSGADKYIYTFARHEIQQNLNQALKNIVSRFERPWSSLDWQQVFAGPLSHAETELAKEMGFPPGDAYLAADFVFKNMGADIISSIALEPDSDRFRSYSDQFIDGLQRKIATFAPRFAEYFKYTQSLDFLLVRNAEPDEDYSRWRVQIVRALDLGRPGSQDRFWFARHATAFFEDQRLDHKTPEALKPFYLAGKVRLDKLEQSLIKLPDSRLRDVAIAAVNDTRAKLLTEFLTLPQRLKAVTSEDARLEVPGWSDPRWNMPQFIATLTDLPSWQAWIESLRAANISIDDLLKPNPRASEPMELNARCEDAMSGQKLLENKQQLSVNVDADKKAQVVE